MYCLHTIGSVKSVRYTDIKVYEETVGTFRIASYIVGVHD